MNTWYIISKKTDNDNTAEFGYGDYPKTTFFVSLVVEAETKRKPQNKAKKISPNRYMFGGINGNEVYSKDDMANMTHIDLSGMLQKLKAEADSAGQDYANKYLSYVEARHDKNDAWERIDKASNELKDFEQLNN